MATFTSIKDPTLKLIFNAAVAMFNRGQKIAEAPGCHIIIWRVALNRGTSYTLITAPP